jgi:hypothetical protein
VFFSSFLFLFLHFFFVSLQQVSKQRQPHFFTLNNINMTTVFNLSASIEAGRIASAEAHFEQLSGPVFEPPFTIVHQSRTLTIQVEYPGYFPPVGAGEAAAFRLRFVQEIHPTDEGFYFVRAAPWAKQAEIDTELSALIIAF